MKVTSPYCPQCFKNVVHIKISLSFIVIFLCGISKDLMKIVSFFNPRLGQEWLSCPNLLALLTKTEQKKNFFSLEAEIT